jgi:hypothetical protein
VAAKNPEEAKASAEKATAKNAATIKARQELNAKHLADLETRFGAVGTEGGNIRPALDQNGNLILQEFKYNEKGEPVDTREVFFWVGDDGISFEILNGSQAIKKLKQGYKGNLEGLRKMLFDKQYISEENYLTKNENALNEGLLLSARNYSTYEVQRYTIDGVTKFTPYNKWLSGIAASGAGGQGNLPTRDIGMYDRDIIEALVKEVYMGATGNAPDEAYLNEKTDYYMGVIKEGILTTTKKKGGEIVRKSTPGFSEAMVRAELPKQIAEDQPLDVQQAKSINFISFLAGLEA